MARLSPQNKAQLLRQLPPPDQRRAVREAAGLARRDIAEELGVTAQAVAAWERGGTPSRLHLGQYVTLLDSLDQYRRPDGSS